MVSYCTRHVTSTPWEHPRLDGVLFARLSGGQNEALVRSFTLMEIEAIVMASDGNKSSGPDGFNFPFIKEFWYLLKNEMRILFDQFHANEVVPKSLLAYFVTLIPKVSSQTTVKELRPISLEGSLYKLPSMVLSRRLAEGMTYIISTSQTSFLRGRNLMDGVLIENEIVDYAKKFKFQCLILKVDFEKAYDSVDWRFLEYMMCRFGFCAK